MPNRRLALADLDWVVTRHGNRLHHAPHLAAEQVEHLEDEGSLLLSVALACGRVVSWVGIPGVFTRLGMTRCKRCCRATGMPEGDGSPKNSDECRAILGIE